MRYIRRYMILAARLGAIALTWLAAAGTFQYAAMGVGPGRGTLQWIAATLVIMTAITTLHIWNFRRKKPVMSERLGVRDMLALLDDDDLDDLRDEARESLRAQIRRLSDDVEVESFEGLMSEAGQKRKRRNY